MVLAEAEPAPQPRSILDDPPINEQILVNTTNARGDKVTIRRPFTEPEANATDESRSAKQGINVHYSDGMARDMGNIYVPDLTAHESRIDALVAINQTTIPSINLIERRFNRLSGDIRFNEHFTALAKIRRELAQFVVPADVRAANRHLFPRLSRV